MKLLGIIWESEDLINWSEERLVEVGIENAGCVWAPEAIFCKEKDAWFMFFAFGVTKKVNYTINREFMAHSLRILKNSHPHSNSLTQKLM